MKIRLPNSPILHVAVVGGRVAVQHRRSRNRHPIPVNSASQLSGAVGGVSKEFRFSGETELA